MANKIILKKSSVAAKVPLDTDLEYGELALNYTDGKLFYKTASNTIAEISGAGGSVSWIKKTTNYTAAVGEKIIADTTAGTFTITLPATPATGDSVTIADGNDWSTTNLTVSRNSSTIEGLSENLTLDIKGIQVEFVYDGATWEVYAFTGPAELPSQTGNSGKYLKTNGTVASWDILAVTPSNFSSQTANTFLAAPNGTSGTPSFRTIVSADVPTLNQNTTGSAATLTTGRTISLTGDVTYTSGSFNGSANVTGTATLANSGVTAGTYTKVTVDAKGRTTVGASLASSDVTTALGFTPGTVAYVTTNNGITGGPIISSGTIGLTGQALALHNLATNGIISRTGSGTVAARTITAGTGISVTNGDGVSGNPTITNSAPSQYLGTATTKAIMYNAQTIGENIAVGATQNAGSFGPITINNGFTVTVNSGGYWTIV